MSTMTNTECAEQIVGWGDLLDRKHRGTVGALCLGVMLYTVGNYIFITAAPAVVADIGGLSLLSWTTTIYVTASIVGAVVAGRLKRHLGVRESLMLAGVLFIAGSLVGAVAPDMVFVLVGRAGQGVGGGLIMALNYTVVRQLFPSTLWPKLFASASAMYGLSAVIGPFIGGVFGELGWWRGALLVVIPFAALFLVLVRISLPARDGPPVGGRYPWGRLALIGAGIMLLATANQVDAAVLRAAFVAAALGLLAWALVVDARRSDRLFPSRPFSPATARGAGLLYMLCISMATISFFVYGPLLLRQLYGVSLLTAGYFITVETWSWTIASLVVAHLPARWDARITVAGPLATTIGLAAASLVLPNGPLWALVPALVLMGAGMGAAWAFAGRMVMMSSVHGEEDATASAIPTVQMIGMAMGSAFAGLIANGLGLGDSLSVETATAAAFWVHAAFVPVAIIGTVAAWRLTRLR